MSFLNNLFEVFSPKKYLQKLYSLYSLNLLKHLMKMKWNHLFLQILILNHSFHITRKPPLEVLIRTTWDHLSTGYQHLFELYTYSSVIWPDFPIIPFRNWFISAEAVERVPKTLTSSLSHIERHSDYHLSKDF